MPELDPASPVSYRTYVDWPSPMPIDRLLKINEIQALMAMNLESRRGALRDLGVQFPDQKIREIFEEVMEDTKEQGALHLIQNQIAAFNMAATGMTPDGTPMMGTDAEGNPQMAPTSDQPGDRPRSSSSWPTARCRRSSRTSKPMTTRRAVIPPIEMRYCYIRVESC